MASANNESSAGDSDATSNNSKRPLGSTNRSTDKAQTEDNNIGDINLGSGLLDDRDAIESFNANASAEVYEPATTDSGEPTAEKDASWSDAVSGVTKITTMCLASAGSDIPPAPRPTPPSSIKATTRTGVPIASETTPSTTSTSGEAATGPPDPRTTPVSKKHIVISYSRSCYAECERIRQYLVNKKYVVWMDMKKLRGNFIEELAAAVRKSYVVIVCINPAYQHSYWCKKEVQFMAKKEIDCIPCFMESPFPLEDWLEFIIGANNAIDFSNRDEFEENMSKLIQEITHHEDRLHTNPRESPPDSPFENGSMSNAGALAVPTLTRGEFSYIIRSFREWVQENRELLRRTNEQQAKALLKDLSDSLKADHAVSPQTKEEFLNLVIETLSTNSTEVPSNYDRCMNATTTVLLPALLSSLITWALREVYGNQ